MAGTQPIQSFVFVDLESTGFLGPKTRITELALVAVNRANIQQAWERKQLPRVQDKLVLSVYPMMPMDGEVTRITGLSNDNLHFYRSFDEATADSIALFLKRQAPPIALVAHNGNKFDFPLLQAEVQCLGRSLCDSLLSIDTVPMFIQLDDKYSLTVEPCRDNTSHKDLMINNAICTPSRYLPTQSGFTGTPGVKRKLFPDLDEGCNAKSTCVDPDDTQAACHAKIPGNPSTSAEDTPVKPCCVFNPESGDCTARAANECEEEHPSCALTQNPDDKESLQQQSLTDDALLEGVTKIEAQLEEAASSQMASSTTTSSNPAPPGPSIRRPFGFYKLENLCERVLGSKSELAHRAEDDAISLLRLFVKLSPYVLPWADSNAVPLKDVPVPIKLKTRQPLPDGVFPYMM